MSQQLSESDEMWFYHTLRDFERMVRQFGAELVLKNLDDVTRRNLLTELYKDKGV
jgi:uncharacterized protein YeaO (DUF488 family)